MISFLSLLAAIGSIHTMYNDVNGSVVESRSSDHCVTFTVGGGTGCAWMCNYCADQLGTYSYYFTTDVCTYQTGGCVGTPSSGVPYTCCSL